MGLIKFIIFAVLSTLYFVIVKVQELFYWQSEKDFWNEQLRTDAEGNYYRSQGCTKSGPETWECPIGVPGWVPRNPDGSIHVSPE